MKPRHTKISSQVKFPKWQQPAFWAHKLCTWDGDDDEIVPFWFSKSVLVGRFNSSGETVSVRQTSPLNLWHPAPCGHSRVLGICNIARSHFRVWQMNTEGERECSKWQYPTFAHCLWYWVKKKKQGWVICRCLSLALDDLPLDFLCCSL